VKKSTRRIVIWTAVGAAALALVALAMMPRPVPADFAGVGRGELQVTLDQEGKTRVRDRFVMSAPMPGRVLRIGLEPGDPVVAGETVLATFRPQEPVPLDARSRAEAKARVKAAQAALDRARAQREKAREEHELAMKERERTLRLAEQGILSQEARDAAETEARAKAEALSAAEAAARNAASELELANAGLLEPGDGGSGAREVTVLRLLSPVDGVVLKRERQSEAIVSAGEPLLEVGDPNDLEIVADYLSMDAVRIRPGMRALIDRWGGDRVIEGSVRRVEPSGFMKVSALGVEEQRVNVIVDFDEPEDAGNLGDEYRVEVRVVIDEREDALKVPASALFRNDEAWAVFVVGGGQAGLRRVEIGARSGFEAEVLEGLAEGDTVIIHPSEQVSDGVRVSRR
jgi:HlyD family secretion protein